MILIITEWAREVNDFMIICARVFVIDEFLSICFITVDFWMKIIRLPFKVFKVDCIESNCWIHKKAKPN